MSKSTVFITQQPKVNRQGWSPDLSPAADYGKFVYIFDSNEFIYQDTVAGMRKAYSKLEDYNPEHDYILWPNTGDPAAIWCTIMAICGMGFNDITFLYWDRKRDESGQRSKQQGFYVPVHVSTDLTDIMKRLND